ncbi:hypothetical protein MMC28_001640 [Mycoblastus sanguinarius]|nr:hypothetical protein [Mycoblastus sanguinarius]
MRGAQIVSLALVIFCAKGLAVPLGKAELGRPDVRIAVRGYNDQLGERGIENQDEPESKRKRNEDEPETTWKRDEDEPGDPWKRDEDEPGVKWKRNTSQVKG